jgi:metacaspase-1
MKKKLHLLLCLLSFFSYSFSQEKKIALVVAVGTYPDRSGWDGLSSRNDLRYIKTALKNNGFKEKDIDTLKDERATKKAIMLAIDRLINRAGKGDVVVFHFSGHGQQIFDDDKKRDELDGYDEAIIPYDAKARYDAVDYQGQNHIRDDELNEKFILLRDRIGADGSLLVLLDACHSGTATRGGVTRVRGMKDALQAPEYRPNTSASSRNADRFFSESAALNVLSKMVVISASSHDQLNYETDDGVDGVGSLSYAFSRAVSQLQGSDISYKILFEKIKADVQSWIPHQTPQIEGNTDLQVMGGKYVQTPEIVTIDKWVNDSTFIIPRGTIHQLNNGVSFQLYPVEAKDVSGPPSATGIIRRVELVRCQGVLTSKLRDKGALKVIFDSKSFGNLGVSVKINYQHESAVALKQYLSQYKYIDLNKANSDLLLETYYDDTEKKKKLQLVNKEGKIVWEKDWPDGVKNTLVKSEMESIWKQARKNAQAAFLRTLDKGGVLVNNVQVEMVPVVTELDNEGRYIIKEVRDIRSKLNENTGEYDFKLGDDFIMKVTNNNEFQVYFSVIDIMPNDEINIMLPDRKMNKTAAEYRVEPKAKLESEIFTLAEPVGKEFFKVVVSKEPLELSILATSRSATRSNLTSFESFFNETFKDEASSNSRGPVTKNIIVGEIGLFPVTFNIVR